MWALNEEHMLRQTMWQISAKELRCTAPFADWSN